MTSLIVYSTVFKLFEEMWLCGARADEAAKVFSYLLKTSDPQLVRGNCFINYRLLFLLPKTDPGPSQPQVSELGIQPPSGIVCVTAFDSM